MLRNDSLLGSEPGTPTHRQGSAPQEHTPQESRSPGPAHTQRPRLRRPAAPPAPGPRPPQPPKEDTHALGPWFTTLIEYSNYSVQIENTVFSYKC